MNDLLIQTSLPIIRREYNGQPVVTFRDIDRAHQRPEGTARKNFNNNKKHFLEGVDYFVQKTDEALSEYGITAPNGLKLFTQTGYLMIVKSFTDDLSWAIQRELVNGYFAAKNAGLKFMGTPVITLVDYCAATGERLDTARRRLRRKIGDFAFGEALLLEGSNLALFLKTNPEFTLHNRSLWILTMDGAKRLAALKVESAKCLQRAALPDGESAAAG